MLPKRWFPLIYVSAFTIRYDTSIHKIDSILFRTRYRRKRPRSWLQLLNVL
jgi:hypothetical protein